MNEPPVARDVTPPPGPSRWYYLLAAGLAVVGGVVGTVSILGLIDDVEAMPRLVAPGDRQLELDAGDYTIYFESRSVVDGKVYSRATLSGMQCAVTSADGRALELETGGASVSYEVGSYTGVSMFDFEAPEDGTYTMTCQWDRAGDDPVVLAVGSGIGTSIGLAVGGILGGIAIGAIIAIVVFVKRRRARRAARA